MDEKYGMIFTEKDVDKLIHIATGAATSGEVLNLTDTLVVFEQEQQLQPTFPSDEPLFIIRGKDKAAFETLVKYIEECEGLGSPDEHIRAAQHSAGKLLAWQQLNDALVKVPD